jgi:hypothetical protein
MDTNSTNTLKQYVWLLVLPALVTPSDFSAPDHLFRVQVQTFGGAGGAGGNAPFVNPGIITIIPQYGAGGNGGNAIERALPCGGKTPLRLQGTAPVHPPRPFEGSPC